MKKIDDIEFNFSVNASIVFTIGVVFVAVFSIGCITIIDNLISLF